MFKNEKDVPNSLTITKNVIKLGDQIYQLRNITRVGIQELNPKQSKNPSNNLFKRIQESDLFERIQKLNNVWFGLFMLFLLILVIAFWDIFLIIGFIGFIYVLYFVFRSRKQKEYALVLETSSSSKALLVSHNESFLRRIVNKINDIMDDLVSSSYTFDLRQDRSIRVGGNMDGSAVTGDGNITSESL